MHLTPALIAYPMVQAAIVAVLGVTLVALRRLRTGGGLIVAACLWLYLCATPACADWLHHTLARQHPPHAASQYPHADAIVLVGGGTLPPHQTPWNAKTNPALTSPTGFSLALYRSNKARNIVISSGDTSTLVFNLLRSQGIKASALHVADSSLTTHQDAVLAAPILRHLGATRILLVTYPIHMPRSVAVFRHEGFEIIAAPSLATPITAPPQTGWWPTREALHLTQSCLHEYLGLAWYRVRGWAN